MSSHFKSEGLVPEVVDLEDWDEDTHEEWSEKIRDPNALSVFFMATYGEGEPTDNAQEFVKRLKVRRANHYASFHQCSLT